VELTHLLSRSEMADLIGTTPETLSRTLTAWVGRGLITVGKGSILVKDPESLRRIAH
jgi:CRP-like cAMP-binding protein